MRSDELGGEMRRVLAMCLLSTACQGSEALLPHVPSALPDAALDAGEVASDAGPDATDAEAAARPDATPILDAGFRADAEPAPDAGVQLPLGARCFPEIYDPNVVGPEYDQFSPTVGSHCVGTNAQDITGIQKVVFLGDSVTQGTPPTPLSQRYRRQLTDLLEARFGDLEVRNCSAWGARADDLLLPPHQQIVECFPGPEPKRTLVVMTVGGNDIAEIMKDGIQGAPLSETRPRVEQFIQNFEDSIRWFRDDPARFPNGVFVVFANMYEFTDGTGDVSACPASGLAGFDGEWPDAEELVVWANEQYMRIAVETQTDMIFLLEHFCGHGFHHDDPTNRCYRGPNTERWFDLTCIHPNPAGHTQIANMFMSVIDE